MIGMVTFAKSQPSPVWLRQHCGKPLPSAAPDCIWHSRNLYSLGLRATGIVSTSPQNSAIVRCPQTIFLRSVVRQPFNAHRAGVVWRFSPIHF